MSDEVKITTETKEEHKCFCQSKGFRKFLVIALGTFVGVYSALCLFTALHKPMMPPHGFGYGFGAPMPPAMQCPCKQFKMHHFDKGPRGDRGVRQRLTMLQPKHYMFWDNILKDKLLFVCPFYFQIFY